MGLKKEMKRKQAKEVHRFDTKTSVEILTDFVFPEEDWEATADELFYEVVSDEQIAERERQIYNLLMSSEWAKRVRKKSELIFFLKSYPGLYAKVMLVDDGVPEFYDANYVEDKIKAIKNLPVTTDQLAAALEGHPGVYVPWKHLESDCIISGVAVEKENKQVVFCGLEM